MLKNLLLSCGQLVVGISRYQTLTVKEGDDAASEIIGFKQADMFSIDRNALLGVETRGVRVLSLIHI